MEITVKEFEHTDVIALRGRLERASAEELIQVLEAASRRGKHNLIVDMSLLEYISSVGLRTLLTVQRNNKRAGQGELILAQVPDHIRQALELTGITDFFKVFDDLPSAIAFTATLPEDPTTGTPPEKPAGQ